MIWRYNWTGVTGVALADTDDVDALDVPDALDQLDGLDEADDDAEGRGLTAVPVVADVGGRPGTVTVSIPR